MHLTNEGAAMLLKSLFDPATMCTSCGRSLERVASYCTWCGAKNPEFDECELVYRAGKTLREAQEDCCNGHPEKLAAIREDIARIIPESFPELVNKPYDQPFCMHCGTQVA